MRHGSFNLSLGGSDIFYLVKLELFHFPGNKKKKKENRTTNKRTERLCVGTVLEEAKSLLFMLYCYP